MNSSPSHSPKGRKNVRFSRQAFVYRIRNYCDSKYSSSIWYSASEMADSKSDANLIAESLEALQKSKTHEDWRGLESRGPQGRWDAYKARSEAANSILDAQDENVSTAELALVARKVAADSVKRALVRGRADAKDAARYCTRELESTPSCAMQTKLLPPKKISASRQPQRFRHVVTSPPLLTQRA